MKNWDSLLDCSYKKKAIVNKVISPLKNCFNIEAMGYFKITRQGHFSYFTNRPETMRKYVENGFLSKDPFYRHPNFYHNQLIVMNPSMPVEILEPGLSDFLKTEGGYQGGFYFLNITSDGMEGFEFGYPVYSNRIDLFLQDSMLVESFLSYFKKETKDLRCLIEQHSISLVEEMGELFFQPPSFKTSLEQKERQNFLQLIGLPQNEFIELHLTQRELEIIVLYLQRKTAPETAKILHLSTRTIENYFETIKDKLHCNHKSEIYDKIKRLVALGYYAPYFCRFFQSHV